MTKTLIVTIAAMVSFASTAFASHPHQALCVVTATLPGGDVIQFLIQTESAREYVSGDPDKDVRDFRYQVRVCDDDNNISSCSTYESRAVSHGATDEVILVGMKDKTSVFFRGHIAPDMMDGTIIHQGAKKKTLVPFTAKLDECIGQSWVKLAREANSNAH
ncbi:MAG TPA: hypothetical protein VFT22_11670 [Kofleriaceae bacterium]|nr:hypothetical protein [Kofleriaceae bacterium]